MCGIAGIFGDQASSDPMRLEGMLDVIQYRGPDDWGRYDDEFVAMGMRRLSVIDLDGGHQPIANEDNTIQIVFNGEIYNHVELRERLRAAGHVFRTDSDTEVIVHLYEEHGVHCLNMLNGMFAIAIWDASQKKMLLARDPMGVKPLYWMMDNKTLVFASEIKCLGQYCPLGDPDTGALASYFYLGYIPRAQTAYGSIRKLLPGHCLTMVAEREPCIEQYWSLSDHFSGCRETDGRPEEIRELLEDAVRIQLRSDVPVGCFLSGGLDSSVLAALASKHLPNLDTFSIRFEDHHFDESPYARRVAAHIGSRHHEISVTSSEMIGLIRELAWYVDEPNWDPAILPSYVVSRYARERVVVALSGTGGDEVFGGYRRHWEERPSTSKADFIRAHVPRHIRQTLFAMKGKTASDQWKRLAYENPEVLFYYGVTQDQGDLLSRLAPELREHFDLLHWVHDVFGEVAEADWINKKLYYDTSCYLADQLLPMLDRTSMAVSLETRVPLLDFRLVEYMARITGNQKVGAGNGKLLLKDVARDLLPLEVVERPKIGFGAPVRRWIQHEAILKILKEVSDGPVMQSGLFEQAVYEHVVQDENQRDCNAALLWAIMMLHLWWTGRRGG